MSTYYYDGLSLVPIINLIQIIFIIMNNKSSHKNSHEK